MEIKNSIAVISGGASGLGAATAKMLTANGAKVVLLDIDQNAAQLLADEIGAYAFSCDITLAGQLEKIFKQISENIGAPRICINCAGIIAARRMVDKDGPLPLQDFQHVINVNLNGTFNVMRLAAAAMIKLAPSASDERGIIINTASIAAYEGQIGQTAYSASKGGIISITLPAARELAQFGIRVMAIAPGLVDTPMFAKLSQETKQTLASCVPFPKRLTKPEEYALLTKQIIENPMLNGSVIRLDGALRMQPK
ncbi:MAG TPA: SDR family NAD(P)-dependent oxidoreductase [Gammaproteobacteria bacterium]|nr:SDR family NAD(P)-dependent oxidoreductase [Gammaproteobacteria bacterium]